MDEFYGNMKYCRFCGERIELYRQRCPYCASLLGNIHTHGIPSYYSPPEPLRFGASEETAGRSRQGESSDEVKSTSPDQIINPELSEQGANLQEKVHVKSDTNPGPQPPDRNDLQTERQCPSAEVHIQHDGPTSYFTSETNSKPLSNGIKVLLTVLCSVIPMLGQAAGIVAALALMISHEDEDRRSFGRALLTASLILFVIWGAIFFAAYIWSLFIIGNNKA